MELGLARAIKKQLKPPSDEVADLLAGDGDVAALALPLLRRRGLQLVACLVGVAEQVFSLQRLQGRFNLLLLVALGDVAEETPGDELGGGGHGLLNQLQERDGLGDLDLEAGLIALALVEQALHAALRFDVERRALHLVDLLQGDEAANLLLGEPLAPEQLTEELE